METFTVQIQLGNDAMRTPADVAAALREIAAKLTHEPVAASYVFDDNGNRVGTWSFA